MKQTIIKFFKNPINDILLLSALTGLILLCVSNTDNTIRTVALGFLLVACICGCIIVFRRYRKRNEHIVKENKNVFDATQIDIDEDVYILPQERKINLFKQRRMSKWGGIIMCVAAIFVTLIVLGSFVVMCLGWV